MPGDLRVACSFVKLTSVPKALAEAGENKLNPVFCATVCSDQSTVDREGFCFNSKCTLAHRLSDDRHAQLGATSVSSCTHVTLPRGREIKPPVPGSLEWHSLSVRALGDRFAVQVVDRRRGCEDVIIGTAIVPLSSIIDCAFFTVCTREH